MAASPNLGLERLNILTHFGLEKLQDIFRSNFFKPGKYMIKVWKVWEMLREVDKVKAYHRLYTVFPFVDVADILRWDMRPCSQ